MKRQTIVGAAFRLKRCAFLVLGACLLMASVLMVGCNPKHRMSDAELKAMAAQYAGEWQFTQNPAVIKIDTDGTWYYKVTYEGKAKYQAEKNTWKLLEDGKILMTDERTATSGNMNFGKIKHENPAWIENGQLCMQEFSTVYRFTRLK